MPSRQPPRPSLAEQVLDSEIARLVARHEVYLRSGQVVDPPQDWTPNPLRWPPEGPGRVEAAALSRGVLRWSGTRPGLRLSVPRSFALIAGEDLPAAWARKFRPAMVSRYVLGLARLADDAGLALDEAAWAAVLPHALAFAAGANFTASEVTAAAASLRGEAPACGLVRAIVGVVTSQSLQGDPWHRMGPFWTLEDIATFAAGVCHPARRASPS